MPGYNRNDLLVAAEECLRELLEGVLPGLELPAADVDGEFLVADMVDRKILGLTRSLFYLVSTSRGMRGTIRKDIKSYAPQQFCSCHGPWVTV